MILTAIEYDIDTRQFALLVYDAAAACWDIVGYANCYHDGEKTLAELKASIIEEQERWYGTPEGSPGWAA